MADLPIVKRQQRASQAGREPAVALPPSLSSLPWLSQLLPSTTVARPPPSASPRHFFPRLPLKSIPFRLAHLLAPTVLLRL